MTTDADPILLRYALSLGKLQANLMSLNVSLRAVLAKAKPRQDAVWAYDVALLQVGDSIPEDAFSDWAHLKELLDEYNSLPETAEADAIDVKPVIDVRHALAHGRVLKKNFEDPFTIIKFSKKPNNGKVVVTYKATMDDAWFRAQIGTVMEAIHKVGRVTARLGVRLPP